MRVVSRIRGHDSFEGFEDYKLAELWGLYGGRCGIFMIILLGVRMQSLHGEISWITFHPASDFAPVILQADSPILPRHPQLFCPSPHADAPLSDQIRLILDRSDLEEATQDTSKRTWSEEEDKKLLHYREVEQLQWEEVASRMENRNHKMCYGRYKRLVEGSKCIWRQRHDERLKRLVGEMGEDWKAIEKHFKKWNARQIKEHYDYYLRPNLEARGWTVEEDLRLVEFVNEHGKNWGLSQAVFPTKSVSHIKNRFYGRLRKLNERKVQRLGVLKTASEGDY